MPDSLNDYFYTEHDETASAKKVILVDGSGSTYSSRPRQESFVGSDCTGSNGDANRVLTLSNTATTIYNATVYINGLMQDTRAGQDYNLLNQVAAEITFLNPVYDADVIVVLYYE